MEKLTKKQFILGLVGALLILAIGLSYNPQKIGIKSLNVCEGGFFQNSEFYFKFPCGATVWNKDEDNSVVIIFNGIKQNPDSFHINDGLYVRFSQTLESLSENETFKEYVNKKASGGEFELLSEIESVKYSNGLEGYSYKIGGSYPATNYYLQFSQHPTLIIHINDGSVDPDNHSYSNIVSEIILSYGLHKI